MLWPSGGAVLAGSTGVGSDASALHLWASAVLPIIGVIVALTVISTALYGSEERSKRAFRLLGYVAGLLRKVGRP